MVTEAAEAVYPQAAVAAAVEVMAAHEAAAAAGVAGLNKAEAG